MGEVGSVYQRNDHRRDPRTPTYFMVIVEQGPSYYNCRRIFGDVLIHENVVWAINEVPIYFDKVG